MQEDPRLDIHVGVGRRPHHPHGEFRSDDIVRVDEDRSPEREVLDLLGESLSADLPHVNSDSEVLNGIREVDDLKVHLVERFDVENAGHLNLTELIAFELLEVRLKLRGRHN